MDEEKKQLRHIKSVYSATAALLCVTGAERKDVADYIAEEGLEESASEELREEVRKIAGKIYDATAQMNWLQKMNILFGSEEKCEEFLEKRKAEFIKELEEEDDGQKSLQP